VLPAVPGVVVPVSPRDLVLGETSLLGSHYASRAELAVAARLVAEGQVMPVVDAVVPPADVEGLHERLRDGTLLGRGAIAWSLVAADT
jgi:D-arabinose 1-dehydrogenase-like Zn-dependent alcohol dehydrogenase